MHKGLLLLSVTKTKVAIKVKIDDVVDQFAIFVFARGNQVKAWTVGQLARPTSAHCL